MAADDDRRVPRREPTKRPDRVPGWGGGGSPERRQLAGSYRAVVTASDDPMARARLQVEVPAAGVSSAWAEACLPPLPIGTLALPAVGDGVWVTFEGGDLERPVWTGVLWDTAAAAALPSTVSDGEVRVTAPRVVVTASTVTLDAALVTCSGTVRCDHLVTTSVTASSYSPGAGIVT